MLPVHRRDDVVRDLITSVTCTCVSSHPTPEMNYVNQLGDIFHGFICRLIACSGILQTGRHMHIHTCSWSSSSVIGEDPSFLRPPVPSLSLSFLLRTAQLYSAQGCRRQLLQKKKSPLNPDGRPRPEFADGTAG